MKARDVMVSKVITVGPDALVQDVAAILLQNRISAVPVVASDGKLLGIVSERDLMRRPEAGTEKQRPAWLEFLTSKDALADEFVKTHSRKVTDVMTADVITASPDTLVGALATLLEKNNIKRVPIVDGGKVVGIVSRANLLQALASLTLEKSPKLAPMDSVIREKVLAELKTKSWTNPWLVNVTVQDGTVNLWGVVDSQAEKKAVRVLAEVTSGVLAVNDNLMVRPTGSGM
jgi:CBS domain-containing protein